MKRSIILLGGGLDSTYLLVGLRRSNIPLVALFFNYSQKAYRGELKSCKYFCKKYDAPLIVVKVELNKLANCTILKGSKIGDAKQNILQGRNAIFISMAVTYAATIGANTIYTGFHLDDPGTIPYLDCSVGFVKVFNAYVDSYLDKKYKGIRLCCPFDMSTRERIVEIYHPMDEEVITKSFTCYEEGLVECRKCVHCKKKMKMKKKLGIK